MKTNALYISAIALLAAISCAKETEISQEEPVVIKNPKVIVAKTDDDITTKTSLSGVSVIWATTDVIMGWDGSGKYNSSSTAVKDEGKKATFTFSALSVEDDLYYLVYPASAVGEAEADEAAITLPTTQTATANGFANGANIAWAEGGVPDDDVSFKNIGGLLSIIINNDNISSVELMANEVMTGAGALDTSKGEATPGAGSKSVILNGGLTNGTEYYAVVYPGDYTGLKIIITRNDGKKAVFTNPNPISVARNSNTHIATLTASNWYTVVNHTIDWDDDGDWSGSGAVITLTDGNYEVELDKTSSGSTNPTISGDNDARVYANGKVTITNSSDRMTSIVFNISTQGKKRLAPITANVGTIKTQASGDDTVEWTGVAKEVVFSVGANANYGSDGSSKAGQLCFDSIDIKTLDDGKTPQTITFPKASYSVVYGNSFAAPTVSGANTTVTYTTSDSSIATVNSSTGAVTINTSSNYGTVRITAKAASDATYRSATAYYDLTVEEPVVLTYVINGESTNVNGYEGQDLDELLPAESPSCGITGYQFDGWSESTVAATNTKPTYTSTKALSAGGLTLYAVFVKVTEEDVAASDVTYNSSDFDGRGTSGSGSEFTHSEGGVDFYFSKAYESGTSHVKLYAGCNATFTASRNITSVVVTFSGNYKNLSGDNFAITNSTGTWSGTPAKTVSLSNTASAQARVSSIVVSLAAGKTTTYSGYTTSPSAS